MTTVGPTTDPCPKCGREMVYAEGSGRCVGCGAKREARTPSTARTRRETSSPSYPKRPADCGHEEWAEGKADYTGGVAYRTDVCRGCGMKRRTEVE